MQGFMKNARIVALRCCVISIRSESKIYSADDMTKFTSSHSHKSRRAWHGNWCNVKLIWMGGVTTVPQTESDLNAQFEWWVRRSVAEMVFITISDYGTVITWFNMQQSCESKQRVSIFKCKALHYWVNHIHDLSLPGLVMVGYPLMSEIYWNWV